MGSSFNAWQFITVILNLSFIMQKVYTANFEARGTDTLNVDLSLNLTEQSSTAMDNGVDINFWIKDETTDAHDLKIFSAFTQIVLNIVYNDVSHVFSIKTTYNGATKTTDIYTSTTHSWINIELQAKSGTLMDILGWNFGSFSLTPSFYHHYTSPLPISDTTIVFHSTTIPQGALFSEVRAYKLQTNLSPGIFYRQYSLANNIPSSMIKYTKITNGTFFLNAQLANAPSISISPTEALSVTICNVGYRMTADLGTCASCSQTGCDYCEVVDTTSYSNLCRYCDISISSCIVSSLCPIDYYKENGICKKCPVGCSECTSLTNCTFCDSGLSLQTQSDGSKICVCSSGKFGLPNSSTDTMVCNSCTSPCAECNLVSTNCTQCSGTNYYIDQTCVSNCGTGKYGDPADNVCKVCGPLCDVCVNSTQCTTCSGGKVISNGACISSCPTNSILIGNVCNTCTTGCKTCSGSITNCNSCISGYYLNGTKCGLTCADGYYGDNISNSCLSCDTSKCTKCLSIDTCTECISTLYLINYKCQSTCLTGYYSETINPGGNVCKSCPVSCAECTSMNKCTYCQNGLYRWAADVNTVTCVEKCPSGYYETLDIDGVTKICGTCMTNCLNCTSTTTCNYCVIGQVSQYNGTQDVCQNQCNPSYYIDTVGKCQQCPTSCSACTSLSNCTSCATGYSLNGTSCIVDATCTGNYYLIAGYCNKCPTECSACTSPSTCTNCINRYHLSGSTCITNCGNGKRDELESCDDGNILDGDGCSSNCTLEANYICIYSTTLNADVCYCDPKLISAQWINNWSIVEIEFLNQITINQTALGTSLSQNPTTFCTQILSSPTGTALGSSTGCKIYKSMENHYIIRIDFSPDAIFGSTNPSTLTLNPYFQTTNGCPKGIPLTYPLFSLPIDEPEIIFNTNSFDVSYCSNSFVLDILNSKGLTNRNLSAISWNVLSINSITTSTEKDSLNSYLSTNYSGLKYIRFDSSTVLGLAGKTVEISVSITNFLGQSSSKSVLVNFLSSKTIVIEGLFTSYSLSENEDHMFYLSTKIPYCNGENTATILSQEQAISISCDLYQSDGTTLVQTLTNCKILMNTMTYPNSYKLKVTASSSALSSANVTKWSDLYIRKSQLAVFISGGDRAISTNIDSMFISNVNPISSNLIYRWFCIDVSSRTYCRDSNLRYLDFPNSSNITLPKGSLVPNKIYNISLVVEDVLNHAVGDNSIIVNAMNGTQLTVQIDSKVNKNGFIDYSKQILFVAIANINGQGINANGANYTWSIINSLGVSLSPVGSTQVMNSLKIPSNTFYKEEIFKVQVIVNYNSMVTNASIVFNTFTNSLYNFDVQPSTGVAFTTEFILSAGSQAMDSDQTNFIFGYIKNNKKYYLTRNQPIPLYTLKLPQGDSGNILTVFCNIINDKAKSIYLEKQITVSAYSGDSSSFISSITNALCESIDESVQIKIQYENFRSSLSSTNKITAISLLLDGLLKGAAAQIEGDEQTSLTIAQSLESISSDFSSLNDSSIITKSFNLFTLIVINNNDKILSSNLFRRFSLESIQSLFSYADNVLSSISIVESSLQSTYKRTIQYGFEYIIRGSMIDQAPGGSAYSLTGTNLSILSSKITSNGFQGNATASGLISRNLYGRNLGSTQINIKVPNTAMQAQNYLQITSIVSNSVPYSINPGYFGGFSKSPMVRVSLQTTDSFLATIGDRTYSKSISVSGLTNPILIEIPYSGKIGAKNTLSCGYTNNPGDTVSFIGMGTTINSGSCLCSTNHLTDFVIEEHSDPDKSIIDPNIDSPTTQRLLAYMSFAFWITTFSLFALIPLIIFAYKRDKSERNKYSIIEMTFDKVHIYNLVFSNLYFKGEVVDEYGNKRPPEEPKPRPVSVEMNSTGFKSLYSEYKIEQIKINKGNLNELEKIDQIYDEPVSKRTVKEEEFKRAIDVLKDENEKEQNDPLHDDLNPNIFDIKGPTFDIVETKEENEPIPEDQQEEIKLNLNKRKGKKKKRSVSNNKQLEEEAKQSEDKEEIKKSEINEETKQPEDTDKPKISGPPKEFEPRIEKKEFKFDDFDDYEGGEDNEDDKIKPYDDYDDTMDNNLYPIVNYGDDTIKPKKRKLKKKPKKPLMPKEDLNSTNQELNMSNFLTSQKLDFVETQKTKITEFDEKGKEDQHLNNKNEPEDKFEIEEDKENKGFEIKPPIRQYNVKYFTNSFKHAHRFTNIYFSYDYRLPRLWRICILYIEFFFMIFMSGIFFISAGTAADVDGLTGYNSLYYAILNVILDRGVHLLIISLILKFKPTGKEFDVDKEKSKDIDATIKDNENDLTVDNNPNEFSRAGLDKTNEVMFNETTNIDSKYLSKLINDSHGSKKMTSISKIFMIICTAVSVLGMWGVILYMSVEFSERGGYLWGWCFCFTSVMSFLCIEPAHVLASSVLLYKRNWNQEDII